MQIDLHGYTKHDAWKRFKNHVEICDLNGLRKFVVITGYGAIYVPKTTSASKKQNCCFALSALN